MSFTSRGSARFNWHSWTAASLKVPAMIVYDVAMKVLDTNWFPQHNIAGLISGITFVILFQSGEAFTMERNTHKHTHTHTQTLVLVKVPTPIRTSSTSLIESFSFSSAKKSRGGCTLFISHLSIHKRNDSDNDSLLF